MGNDRGSYLRPFFIVLTIAIPTGLDNQTLENVNATNSDKRAESGRYLLKTRSFRGSEKLNKVTCKLDKREH